MTRIEYSSPLLRRRLHSDLLGYSRLYVVVVDFDSSLRLDLDHVVVCCTSQMREDLDDVSSRCFLVVILVLGIHIPDVFAFMVFRVN